MAELPTCKLCGAAPRVLDETLVYHPTEVRCALSSANAMSHVSWAKLMGQGEAVAVVDCGEDGFYADILPDRTVKVGQMLYTQAPAVDDGVPKGWRIEQDGEGFRVDSPDDHHIIVRKQERAPVHYWENMLYELCKAMKEQQDA